jgi:prophage regulatory protein
MDSKGPKGLDIDIVYRLKDVLEITGASRSSIYQWVHAGIFPPPIKIGARAVGWRRSAVQKWLDERP